MKTAIYYRHNDPADRDALESLEAGLRRRGIEVCHISNGQSTEGCDLLLSIGGDGTLLSCVQFVRGDDQRRLPPLLGVNFGHLGFLTTVGRDNLDLLADDLLAHRYTLEERTLLQVDADNGLPLADGQPSLALNEVFVHRREENSLLRTEVYVDGLYVATYAGDGVIVATPTGSTAYSLSCGGPILTPDSRCFVITPISAHTLTLRPIIVADTATIELRTLASPCTLGLDSRRYQIDAPVGLILRRAEGTVSLVRTARQNFYSAIRDKLMWGTEVRP